MLRIVSTGSAAAAAILVSTLLSAPASAAGSPLGIWLDDKGRGAIEISKCGSTLCGKVVWVKSASDRKGCGVKILGNVKPAGQGTWDYGWIYSPDHGRRFDVALTPVGSGRLRVTGYAGIKLFGESRMWTRAPADLERCDGDKGHQENAATAPAPSKADVPVKTAKAAPEMNPPATRITPPAAKPAADADVPVLTSPPKPATPPSATNEPAPQPAPEIDTAAADPAEAGAEMGSATPDTATSGPGGLSFEKLLKKSADGRCKLDLPWVKIDFNCKDM